MRSAELTFQATTSGNDGYKASGVVGPAECIEPRAKSAPAAATNVAPPFKLPTDEDVKTSVALDYNILLAEKQEVQRKWESERRRRELLEKRNGEVMRELRALKLNNVLPRDEEKGGNKSSL